MIIYQLKSQPDIILFINPKHIFYEKPAGKFVYTNNNRRSVPPGSQQIGHKFHYDYFSSVYRAVTKQELRFQSKNFVGFFNDL